MDAGWIVQGNRWGRWAKLALNLPKSAWIRLRAMRGLALFWLRQPMFLLALVATGFVAWMIVDDLASRKSAIHWLSGGSLLPKNLSGFTALFFDGVHWAVVGLLFAGVLIKLAPLLRPAAQSAKGMAAKQRYAEEVERLAGENRARQEAEELKTALREARSRDLPSDSERATREAAPKRNARRL